MTDALSTTEPERWALPGRRIHHAGVGFARLVWPLWWGRWLARIEPAPLAYGGTRPARWAVLDRNFTVQPVEQSADAGET